jgi:hypothetical protein
MQHVVGARVSRQERSIILIFIGIVIILATRREHSTLTPSVGDETSKMAVRTPPKSLGTYCTHEELNSTLFKSQDKEDVQLLTWFNNLCGGRYVEMGGLDGVTFSNSYVFNKGLDWTGVLGEYRLLPRWRWRWRWRVMGIHCALSQYLTLLLNS